jgi:hypothetical protein
VRNRIFTEDLTECVCGLGRALIREKYEAEAHSRSIVDLATVIEMIQICVPDHIVVISFVPITNRELYL